MSEEQEIVDPMTTRREKCSLDPKILKLKQRLEECNKRVSSRKKTEETCFEEIIDYVSAVDHCAHHGLFDKLK